LVLPVLVDVGDAQLRLPQEGVVGPFEHLPLLRDRADDGLQGRTLVDDPEGVRLDLPYNLLDAAPDGPEVLRALLPQELRAIRAAGVVPPPADEGADGFMIKAEHGGRSGGRG